MKSNTFWILLAIVAIFLAGYFVSVCFNVPEIMFENELNPLDALSILVTIILAVIIALHFDVHKEQRKNIQEIVSSRIRELQELIDKLQDKVSENDLSFYEVASIIKRINSSLMVVFNAIERGRLNVRIDKTEYQKIINDIKKLATDTSPVPPGTEPAIAITSNKIRFSTNRIAEIVTKTEVFKNKVFDLQITLCTS